MKKRMNKGICLVVSLIIMLGAMGCGQKADVVGEESITESSVSISKHEAEEVQPTPVPEIVEDTEEIEGLQEISDVEKQISMQHYERLDTIDVYSKEVNGHPYYIGRDNYEANIDYMMNHKTAEDGFVYLGLPLYLPNKVSKDTCYVTVSDENVAKVENNELIGLQQGVFVLSTYDENKTLIEEKKYVCTTFNDSKTDKEALMTIKVGSDGMTADFINARDFEYWKKSVHTIMDMSFMLQARHFVYDFYKEPAFGVIEHTDNPEEVWNWTAHAETIFDMSGGVCIEVAQLALAMLAEDYEDWGVVLVEGEQGHIFNWFFEDGYYYIFDFTQVISDNAWSKSFENGQYHKYWDYSDKVVKCADIEEIKEYIVTKKVDTRLNYLVYMYSCKGHDYIACNLNTAMNDSYAANRGDFEEIIIGYQDVVMEDLVVLYQKEGIRITFKSFDVDQINNSIPCGIYNNNEKLTYRHPY
ncbi:MAG: hypothetical protein IKJ39_04010 [Lachnospiraceae bacterium]|nr:hypothetical protein [Lachnospiraceae bacterium]